MDVCILTSHTATLKSMESKAVAIPLCTPCFAKRLSVSVRCLHWLAIKHPKARERSFILKHRNRFFLKVVGHRKTGRFLPHLPLACLQDPDWTCQNHLSPQAAGGKQTGSTFTASKWPFQTMTHALETAWHNETKTQIQTRAITVRSSNLYKG